MEIILQPWHLGSREVRKEGNKFLMVNRSSDGHPHVLQQQPRLTFQAHSEQTSIAERELKRNLQSLAMGKPTQRVLCRKGKGKGIDATDEFSVNDNFQSKLIRITIQLLTSKGESEPEKKETKSKVEDDRKSEVEARSQQPHHGGDAAAKVSFLPNPILIKKRIESLIERDYFAQDAHDLKLYHYVA